MLVSLAIMRMRLLVPSSGMLTSMTLCRRYVARTLATNHPVVDTQQSDATTLSLDFSQLSCHPPPDTDPRRSCASLHFGSQAVAHRTIALVSPPASPRCPDSPARACNRNSADSATQRPFCASHRTSPITCETQALFRSYVAIALHSGPHPYALASRLPRSHGALPSCRDGTIRSPTIAHSA